VIPDKDSKTTKRYQLRTAISIGLALLFILGLAALLPNSVPDKSIRLTNSSLYLFDTDLKNVIQGDTIFEIPRNYFSHWYPNLNPNDAIGLHIKLPEFAPISPKNAECFLDACDQIIWIAIAGGHFPNKYWLSKQDLETGVNAKKGPFGLTEYIGYPHNEEFASYETELDDGSLFSLGCSIGDDLKRLNMCHHRENIGDNVYFQYDFNLKYLAQWRDIQKNIKSMIEGFRKK
jgi:hypothetical protein